MKKLTKEQKEKLILIEYFEELLICNEINENEFSKACQDINYFLNNKE